MSKRSRRRQKRKQLRLISSEGPTDVEVARLNEWFQQHTGSVEEFRKHKHRVDVPVIKDLVDAWFDLKNLE